ncbi:MAG: DMT family transporter [Bacteroidia bacterium]|nr:DMT family transporter [Bacteroidia bacterium]
MNNPSQTYGTTAELCAPAKRRRRAAAIFRLFRRRYIGHAAMILQIFLIGPAYVIVKQTTLEFDPVLLQTFRSTIAGTALAIFFFARGGLKGRRLEWRDWTGLLALSISGMVVNQIMYLVGLRLTTPANSALIYALTPMLVFAASIFWLKSERATFRKSLGVGLALAGALTTILTAPPAGRDAPNIPLGNAFTVVALFAWTFYVLKSPSVVARVGALIATAIPVWMAAAIFLPFGLPKFWETDFSKISAGAWFGLAYVSLYNSALSFFLMAFAFKSLKSSQAAVYMNAPPIIAGLFSVAMGYDEPRAALIIGAMLTVSGIYLLNSARRKN